jgi:hypothetical protein
MDNRYFKILGHATRRLLLNRVAMNSILNGSSPHARQSGCFSELNSSPDRLDLSSENAWWAAQVSRSQFRPILTVQASSQQSNLALSRSGVPAFRKPEF